MTFNVRGGDKAEDGVNTWSNRASLNTSTIIKCCPDIIGFQECQFENLTVYRSSLPEYSFYLGHITGANNYNPIFWRSSFFDLIGVGAFWLNSMPDAREPSRSWNASCDRSATWVKLLTKDRNFALVIVNNHWDHISEEARQKSAHLLSKKAIELSKDSQLPIVACGDFNCSPWLPQFDPRSGKPPSDEPYRYLIAQRFIDCFTAANNKDSLTSNTFHGFMGEDYKPWKHHMLWRADWIMLLDLSTSMKVQTCSIVRESTSPLYASDHYPLIADLIVL